VGETDARALQQLAILEHARDAAAALGALPRVAFEAATVERLEPGDDAALEVEEVVANGSLH
jgi:hypothetical protein